VEHIINHLKLKEAVIKIQVHAGGRGKAGGVKFAKTPEEILKISGHLLGMKMVNNQTGPEEWLLIKSSLRDRWILRKNIILGRLLIETRRSRF